MRLDRKAIRAQDRIAGDEKRAGRPHGERNDLDAIAIEQTAPCLDQRRIVGRGNSRQFLKLAKIGLDEIDACFQGRLQEGAGRIHDDPAVRFRSLGDPAEKIVRHAGRQAAARDDERRRRRDARQRFQTRLPFGIAERRAREDQAKLLAGGLVEDRQILPRVVRGRDHDASHAFALEQISQQLPGGAAGRVNRGRVDAEPPENPGDVDPASPGIAMGRRASHLGERHHLLDRRRDVERGVDGEGDDLRHRNISQWLRPPPNCASPRTRHPRRG